jgi:hypothetical protein
MFVLLMMWENKVITEAANNEYLTYIPRPVRIRVLTLALVAVMELGFSISSLKLANKVTTVAVCHLVFSFLRLRLGGWV